jgi:hypothetical protein
MVSLFKTPLKSQLIFQQIPKQQQEIRSTEDLYIDDDFFGGANMELLPPPNDFFGSIDTIDIFSAEFFHTQEHDEDYEEATPKHPQIEYATAEDKDKDMEMNQDK